MTTRVASDIELIVIAWLERRNIVFQFQTSLSGGWYSLGGSVVDFLFPARRLAWRVMGAYFHEQVGQRGRDLIQKENLAAMGLTVIDIWGNDLEDPRRREETLQKALIGQEMLR